MRPWWQAGVLLAICVGWMLVSAGAAFHNFTNSDQRYYEAVQSVNPDAPYPDYTTLAEEGDRIATRWLISGAVAAAGGIACIATLILRRFRRLPRHQPGFEVIQ